MASSSEKLGLAAAREEMARIATAPGGGGEKAPDPPRGRAAALRQRAAAHRERAASSMSALASARSLAHQTFLPQGAQGQLKGLKDQLRDLESQLAEALSVQSRRESKRKLTTEAISNASAMNKRLSSSVADLRDQKDRHTQAISQQLQVLEPLEAKSNKDAALREQIEQVLSWYHKHLGFQVVGGGEAGVKFVFNKMDPQSPEKEYSFCLYLDKDRYNLLQCDPHVEDIDELMKDLNLSNDLPRFVRIVRERFRSSATNGTLPVHPAISPSASAAPSPSPSMTRVMRRIGDECHSRSRNKGQSVPSKRIATALSGESPGGLRRSPRIGGMR